jgi:hypothetical protein
MARVAIEGILYVFLIGKDNAFLKVDSLFARRSEFLSTLLLLISSMNENQFIF